MRKKNFTLATLRRISEENAQAYVFEKKLPRRRGICCLCRCDPKRGIVVLHPINAKQLFDEQVQYILRCSVPARIASRALMVGDVLAQAGRPNLALRLMRSAYDHLINTEWNIQEDYVANHYYPRPEFQQWYLPWRWRISEWEARRLAARIDELSNEVFGKLGYNQRSTLRLQVHRDYESMFEYLYEVC